MKSLIIKYGKRMVWLVFILSVAFFLPFLLVSERVSFRGVVWVMSLFSASVSLTIALFLPEPVVKEDKKCSDVDYSSDSDDDEDGDEEEGRELLTFEGEGIEDQAISGVWNGAVVETTTKEGVKLNIHVSEGARGWSIAQVQIEKGICLVFSGERELTVERILIAS